MTARTVAIDERHRIHTEQLEMPPRLLLGPVV